MATKRSDGTPRRIFACFSPTGRVEELAAETWRLARWFGAEAGFLCVAEDTAGTRRRLEDAIERARAQAGGESAAPASPLLHLLSGSPAPALCAAARRLEASLLVAGALEREGVLKTLAGSVARRLARNAPCSTLLLPWPRREGTPFRSIVASVNFDAVSASLLRFLAALARRQGGVVKFQALSEYDLYGVRDAIGGSPEAPQSQWEAEELARLREFAAEANLEGLAVETACVRSRDGGGSVAWARDHAADLLALPAPPRRLTGWDRFFHHPAEFALESLRYALLLYRQPGAPLEDGENAGGPSISGEAPPGQ